MNVTALLDVVVLKPEPAMVTVAPTGPDTGDTLKIATGAETVKVFHVADELPTVTFTGPLVAPLGTVTTSWVELAEDTVAATPLNVTALLVAVALKPEPVIVTAVPTMPLVGDTLVIANDAPTIKLSQVADELPTVTFTGPLVAPLGTVTTSWVELAEDTVAALPLNVTASLVFVVLKPEPEIVTLVPTGPVVGEIFEIATPAVTVKLFQVADELPTVTFTLPLVAPPGTFVTSLVELADDTLATTPLNVTLFVEGVEPKPLPVIVTEVPTGPTLGLTLLIDSANAADAKADDKHSTSV